MTLRGKPVLAAELNSVALTQVKLRWKGMFSRRNNSKQNVRKPADPVTRRSIQTIVSARHPQVCQQSFNDKDGPGAEARHKRISDPTLRKQLTNEQHTGCGSYATVNTTDGNGHTRTDILRARAAFFDLDDKPTKNPTGRPS